MKSIKKVALWGGGTLLLLAITSGGSGQQNLSPTTFSPSSVQHLELESSTDELKQKAQLQPPEQSVQNAVPTSSGDPALSNDNHYTNSVGDEIHSPATTTDNSVPAGATAQCADGTYSFSQHRSGTCSRHGGVAEWL